jgi:hypothetical protein
MEEIYGIRRANLLALVDGLKQAKPQLLQQDIARELNCTPAHFSQMKSGSSVVGDDVARKIEVAQRLPFAWMDNVHTSTASRIGEGAGPYLSQGLRIDPATIAAALKLVRLTFLQREQVIDQEVNAEPLAHAYEFLMARREHTVTPENVVDFALALKRRQTGESNDAQAGDDRSAGGSNRKHHARR